MFGTAPQPGPASEIRLSKRAPWDPLAHDSHLLPVGGWTSNATPGALFRDIILSSLHLDSAVAFSFESAGAAVFWVSYLGPLQEIPCSMVNNALNFSLSALPARFAVAKVGPGIFCAAVRNQNVANLIVASGHCRLGDLRLDLFSDHSSAMASRVAADDRGRVDPSFELSNGLMVFGRGGPGVSPCLSPDRPTSSSSLAGPSSPCSAHDSPLSS